VGGDSASAIASRDSAWERPLVAAYTTPSEGIMATQAHAPTGARSTDSGGALRRLTTETKVS
jgi:hypothetical protein